MPRASEALAIILGSVKPLAPCAVPLADALGLVLAQDLAARDDVPPFASSAMDGYAVLGSDVAGASHDAPVRLRVLQDVPAGQVASCRVQPGTAVRIMTGAAVPDGADCVVRVEDTFSSGEEVVIRRGVPAGVNVRPIGEDILAGTTVFPAGTVIRPAELGVLASVGCATVPVYPAAKVAVVTTGDELVDVGEPLVPGKIRDANSYTLTAQVRQCGAEPLLIARVADTLAATRHGIHASARAGRHRAHQRWRVGGRLRLREGRSRESRCEAELLGDRAEAGQAPGLLGYRGQGGREPAGISSLRNGLLRGVRASPRCAR